MSQIVSLAYYVRLVDDYLGNGLTLASLAHGLHLTGRFLEKCSGLSFFEDAVAEGNR